MNYFYPFSKLLFLSLLLVGLDYRNSNGQTLSLDANRISIVAGSTQGSANGVGINAQFNLPTGVCADTFGNYYVADFANHLIRKITSTGVVTTFAGNGSAGFLDGSGTTAKFNNPTGITCDFAGNVYVADQFNNRIRKITPSGLVSTFAGDGFIGSIDGSLTTARFNFPTGIATDGFGNFYVADQYNHKIRKISSGVVSTLAGTGAGGNTNGISSVAQFSLPTGVALDLSGNVYVADYGNNLIRKVTSTGITSTFAGTGAAGFKDTISYLAEFSNPSGIFVDQNNDVIVADKGNNRIRRISNSANWVSTFIGGGNWGNNIGVAAEVQLANPYSIVKNKQGAWIIGDAWNNRIKRSSIVVLDTFYSTIGNSQLPVKAFSFEGRSLISSVEIYAPNGFEISLNNSSGFVDTLILNPNNGEIFKNIWVRFKANLLSGNYIGSIRIVATSASDLLIPVVGVRNCDPNVLILTSALSNGNVGFDYNENFLISGLLAPPIWKISSGVLPNGLSLDSILGNITGKPTQIGSNTFTVTAKSGNCSYNKVLKIDVYGTPTSRFNYTPNSCSNRGVQFTNNSILDTAWHWDFGDGTTSSLTSPFHIYSKDSVYIVKLQINGSGPISTDTVYVATTPVIGSITPISSCNFVYTLTGAPVGYGYTYAWGFEPGTTYSGDTIVQPKVSFNFSGSTSIDLSVSAQGRCLAVASPLVFNTNALKVGVTSSLNISAPSNNFCSTSRILTNTSTGSGNVFMYSLDGGAFTSISAPVNLNLLSIGSHLVKLAAHDSSCYDTSSASFAISNATANFVEVSNICNQELSFSNSSTVEFGSPSYFWVFGSPSKGTSTLAIPTFNFGVPGVDTVQLQVTATSGCTSNLKKSVLVGSGTGPTANFTYSIPSSICSNQVQFTNTTFNGNGGSYTWDFGDTTFSNLLNPSKGFADTGLVSVKLTVTKATCSSSITLPVYISSVSSGPISKFSISNPSQFFDVQSFNFYNLSKHLNPGYNSKYYWSFGDGTVDSSNNSIYNKKFNSPGIYTITLASKSSVGCIDISSQTVDVKQIVSAKFNYVNNSCSNRDVQFEDSSTLATSYLWEFGDGDTSTLVNPNHTYLKDSIYTVRLTINGTISYSKDVTVATTPFVPSISYTKNCNNQYTFLGPLAGQNLNYTWVFDTTSYGNSTNLQNPTRYFTKPGNTSVFVMVFSYGRCGMSPSVLNFTPELASEAAIAKMDLTPPFGNYCANSRTITNLSNSSLTATYNLDADTFAPIGSSIDLTNLSIGFHVARIAVNNGTCFDTTFKEFFISSPIPSFISNSSSCNQVVSFTNTSSATDNGALKYYWSFGKPSKGNSVDVNPSFDFGIAGIDTVSLMVTSSSGCTVSTNKEVLVGSGTTNLKPNFSAYLVPSICENKFQFYDSTTGGGSGMIYSWNFGDGNGSNQKNPIKSFYDTGWVSVSLTTNMGSCFSTKTQSVYVSPSAYGPVASFSNSKPIQALPSNSFNFINTSKTLNAGWIQKYIWYLGDGMVDSVNNYVFGKNYLVPDTFNVTLVVLASTGCIDSTSKQVIVYPIPFAKFGVELNTCANRLVNFVDSSTLASSYLWDFGDGDTSNLASPTHLYAKDGVYEVVLKINGLEQTTKTITVLSNPSATYSYTKNNCSNEFLFEANDIGDLYTYQWVFGSGNATGINTASAKVTFDSIEYCHVLLQVSSGGLCTSQSVLDSVLGDKGTIASASVTASDYCSDARIITNTSTGGNSYSLSLDTDPFNSFSTPVSFTGLGWGDHQLRIVSVANNCIDTAIQFFKVSDINGGFSSRSSNCDRSVEFFSAMEASDASPIQYLWDFAGEDTSTNVNPVYYFSFDGKRKVTMTAKSESGCTKTYSDSIVVNSSTGPIATYLHTEVISSACQTGVNFVSTSPNGTQFYWSFGDGQVSNQTKTPSTFHAYLDTGYYATVMVAINDLGCIGISDTIIVKVTAAGKPTPTALFSINDTVQCISQQNFNFINSSYLTGIGWITNYQWDFGDGNIDTLQNSIYGKKYPNIGTYTVSLTATTNLGCTHLYSIPVIVQLDSNCAPAAGLVGLNQKELIQIYPNPNSGQFILDLGSVQTKTKQINIIDLLGRVVGSKVLANTAYQKLELDFDLANGKYYLEMVSNDGSLLRKPFVVVK
ncbi:MAG: PKD domain-containing protein [Bacteroidia bacterium]|nr:PKD domain-containing protein [Bacteroidia bacterium]MCF8446030.1 PKD domain-containing protein [Bacteroidia bacterium]